MLVLGPLGWGFGAGQCQKMYVTGLGLSVWTTVLFTDCDCLLGLGECGKSQAVYKGQLLIALSGAQINKTSKALRLASTC